MLSVSFSGSYTYTITERKKINGEKVEKVRSISKREYEVCDISTVGIYPLFYAICRHCIGLNIMTINL